MKNPKFTDAARVGKYTSAIQSTDPNYLRKKFAAIKRAQQRKDQEQTQPVRAQIVLVK